MRLALTCHARGATLALLALLALLAGCGPELEGLTPPSDPEATARGGKADLTGSCAGLCGASQAAPGGCWCDASCARYGDCCADKASLCDATFPPPRATPPATPARNDPRFAVTGLRHVYLVGNALTQGHDRLELAVRAPAETKVVDLWIDGGKGVRLARQGAAFTSSVDLSTVAPGSHRVLLAADGGPTAFARFDLLRTHPLYVVVSNDWDDADNPDATLARQEYLHARHPELKLTHFVGPYTFTDPSVSTARAARLVAWLKGMKARHGDELGLHIHPYCNFVETTAVTCRTRPSFRDAGADATGYTVVLSSYTEEETLALLRRADELFVQHGLGKPTSFRAGGWTAELHTLRALARAGYLADTSGCNWKRLEEWKGWRTSTLYSWNETHWATIGDTSQPYYPSTTDILRPGKPAVPLLEVPDNGLLVDYVTADEMIAVFRANWPGGALATPRAYSIGYHPPNFSEEYKRRIDDALTHVDGFLASADRGPVVYARLSDLARVWPKP